MTSKACRSGVTEKGSWNIQVWQVPWQTSPAGLEFEPRCQLRLEQGQFQSCGSWCALRHAWPHGSCAADSVLVQYIGHRIQIETSCDLFPWAKHVSMFEVSWMRHPHTVWNRSPNYAQSQMLCPKLFDGVLNCLVVVSNALDDSSQLADAESHHGLIFLWKRIWSASNQVQFVDDMCFLLPC